MSDKDKTAPVFDVPLALSRIKAHDIKEDWVPDVLRHEDQFMFGDEVVAEVESLMKSMTPHPPVEIEIPKTPFFTRSGQLLSFQDRIAYQAVVQLFSDRVDTALSGAVYSARTTARTPYFTKRSIRQWKSFRRAVRRDLWHADKWLIASDLTAYFDSIRHDFLFQQLEQLDIQGEILKILGTMLDAWAVVPGQGIPQGPNASRILGNLFLVPVDDEILMHNVSYFRYMDDVRIVAVDKREVTAAMRAFERACRRLGLSASPAKTTMSFGKEARRQEAEPLSIRMAGYWLDGRGSFRRARYWLHLTFRESLSDDDKLDKRKARFSLWRMFLNRDPFAVGAILEKLEDFAPVAGVVAEYMSTFIRQQTTRKGLSDFLSDGSCTESPFLLTWIFAACLEHPPPVPNEWVSRARLVAKDRNHPSYLRAIAVNLLTAGGQMSDVLWVRNEVRREHDPTMIRAFVVALARVRQLDEHTKRKIQGRSSELSRTIRYLEGRGDLPSIVSSGRVSVADLDDA